MNTTLEFYESEDMEKVWKLFAADKKKTFVAVLIPPAVRVRIGEKFDFYRGEDAVGKVTAILKILGADAVIDSAIGSDVVVALQAKAVAANRENSVALPVFSSECPKWRNSVAESGAEVTLLPTASEICARLVKQHYRRSTGKSVRVIAVEPCGHRKPVGGADVTLTIDELAKIIECTEVNLRLVKKESLETPLGVPSGAAYLCALNGGNSEALARYIQKDKTRFAVQKLLYSGVYKKSVRREAEMCLNGEVYRFAVASSVEEGEKILAEVLRGQCAYDFVEVAASVGGALGKADSAEEEQTLRLRALGLRYLDNARAARSADSAPYTDVLVKTWERMVRTGEAAEVCESFDTLALEESLPIEEVEEIEVNEAVAEPVVVEEAAVAEEPAAEIVAEPVEETAETVEEIVEEAVAEPVVVEEVAVAEEPAAEVVAEPVEETAESVEETVAKDVYYRRLSMKERKKLKKLRQAKAQG